MNGELRARVCGAWKDKLHHQKKGKETERKNERGKKTTKGLT
jgi:hypothetical protein